MCNISISVIIPVFNTEEYLETCLDSVINQTLKNIEIITVNDGSTDKSLDILNKYKSIDSRITVINIPNSKQGKCRNLGIDIAKGKYVYFIDSDDYIKPDTLQILLEEIEKDKNDIMVFNGRAFYDRTNIFSGQVYFKIDNDYINVVMSGFEFAKKGISFVSPCMKLYRKDFLNNNNIRFAEGVYGEDDIFWYKCCLLSKSIKYIDKELYFRRIRPNSIMTSKNINIILDRLKNIIQINELLACYKNDNIVYFYNNLSISTLELIKDGIKLKIFNVKHELRNNFSFYRKIIFNNKLSIKYNIKAFIIVYLPFIYIIACKLHNHILPRLLNYKN